MSAVSRRHFLKATSGLGAGLVLGACSWFNGRTVFTPQQATGDELTEDADMLGWIFIGTDGGIRVTIPSAEMGQGVYTNLALLVAEEMDADFSHVSPEPAPVNPQFRNPRILNRQITGGSTSTPAFWTPMREVGATARAMLLATAAIRWDTASSRLSTKESRVHHPDGRTLSFGELAADAALLDPPSTPPLKVRADFRLIGTSQARLDTPDKVRGTARFGVDVRLPGMVYASVRHAHAFKGTIASVEGTSEALAMPGVIAIEVFDTWLAVVAEGWWQANQAVKSLRILQDTSRVRFQNSEQQRAALIRALDQEGKSVPQGMMHTLDVEYEVPFLEHGTMSPMNCTAHVTDAGCEIWAPTQAQTDSRRIAAKALGMPRHKVHINTTYLGGGFGRRSNTDFVKQAALLSQRVARPVQLIWSREETTQHGFYRPAAISRFQIGIDQSGDASQWRAQIAVPNVLISQLPEIPDAVWSITGDFVALEGFKHPPYAVGKRSIEGISTRLDTPTGFWRAVGHSYNGFFVESIADEIAHASGQDPAAYRRKCYASHTRHAGVLESLLELAQWNRPRERGRHLGLAVHESFGSVCGQVVELSVAEDKTVTLHKIWCVINCGIVVNPDSIEAQMQGGIVYGLSAATRAQNTLVDGGIAESNFHDYPAMRLNEIPPMEVRCIDSEDHPGGVGEVSVPPIAAAVGNAIFEATGERVRKLPFSEAGYTKWRSTRG